MNPINDPPTPSILPSRSIDRRTVLFLMLPSIGFLTLAIALITTGNKLQIELSKPLVSQHTTEIRDTQLERRLAKHDPDLTPEKIMGLLRSARRGSDNWKDMAARIGGTMRTFGLLALVPIALQVYVIVRAATQHKLKRERSGETT